MIDCEAASVSSQIAFSHAFRYKLLKIQVKNRTFTTAALLGCMLFRATSDAAPQNARVSFSNLTGKKDLLDSFELIWSTLRDHYWDPSMAGLNWQAIHDQYLRKITAAPSSEAAKQLMSDMIERLPSSHLAIIPQWRMQHTTLILSHQSPQNPRRMATIRPKARAPAA